MRLRLVRDRALVTTATVHIRTHRHDVYLWRRGWRPMLVRVRRG